MPIKKTEKQQLVRNGVWEVKEEDSFKKRNLSTVEKAEKSRK